MKIQKKSYYCISFRLSSPLAVGSGQNEETDKDLTLEGDGWRLISEDDVKLENNPLSSLKDLL